MSRRRFQQITAMIAVLVFVWVLHAPINQAGSDPRGSLLVAQALLETGSLRLDPYLEAAELPPRVLEVQDHRVDYYFPLGTPLVALPAVALTNAAGLDMARALDEARLHKWLAALSVALAIVLVATLAGDAVPEWASSFDTSVTETLSEAPTLLASSSIIELALLVLGLSLGTGLTSTLGTAFWSNNTTVLANLAILILVQRWVWPLGPTRASGPSGPTSAPEIQIQDPLGPPLVRTMSSAQALSLGALATISCLSRPTGAILFLGVFALILWNRDRRGALWLLAIPSLSAFAFTVFSLRAYGSLTPPYYHPARLSNSESLAQILYGNTLGPGRGFLVFSPFLLLVIPGIWRYRASLLKYPLTWLAGFWATAHLFAMSRFPHWWGGHTFGNRLYLDAIPAWILLSLLVWRAWHSSVPTPRARRSLLLIALPLLLFGVWVHAWQGLYNLHSVMWNGGHWGEALGDINIDEHHEYLFDWRYPQMLASESMIRERFHEHGLRAIPYYPVGRTLTAEDDPRHFDDGFYPVEQLPGAQTNSAWRWSKEIAAIVFRLDMDAYPATSDRLQLQISAGSLQGQPVELRLNGRILGRIEPEAHFTPVFTGYFFDPSLLTEVNHVTFRAANAHAPAGDSRVLGMAFYDMQLLGEEAWLEPWFVRWIPGVNEP